VHMSDPQSLRYSIGIRRNSESSIASEIFS
jgi:hypothetical protein